jgi:hypothetical protein
MKQKLTMTEAHILIAGRHVVFAYPRRGEVVVDGFKRYDATPSVIRNIIKANKGADDERRGGVTR